MIILFLSFEKLVKLNNTIPNRKSKFLRLLIPYMLVMVYSPHAVTAIVIELTHMCWKCIRKSEDYCYDPIHIR